MTPTILIVDDDPSQRRLIEATIHRLGYDTAAAGSGSEAVDMLTGENAPSLDVVLLDLTMPGMSGIEVLEKVRPSRPYLPVIVLTAHGGIDVAVNAMRAGATDFMVKPVAPQRLQVAIEQAVRHGRSTGGGEVPTPKVGQGGITPGSAELLGDSRAMRGVMSLVGRAGGSGIPILIEGESGVGKELVARAIHARSDRAAKPLITVNCGAIPESLVESILFGHEKGAFTGANERHAGKFQEASGGTLFLDEISELRTDLQVKLLRALQEGEIDPVGGRQPVPVDIRLISATNRNLWDLVQTGQFREDLYYRLNVFPIYIPPLRERREDIMVLARHFLSRFAKAERKEIDAIATAAERLLSGYHWPGNVRQLENAVFRAVVLCDGDSLELKHFPQIAQTPPREQGPLGLTGFAEDEGMTDTAFAVPAISERSPSTQYPASRQTHALAGRGGDRPAPERGRQMMGGGEIGGEIGGDRAPRVQAIDSAGNIRPLTDIEADVIRLAMIQHRGRVTEVARRLGIGRSTLYRKLREHDIDPDSLLSRTTEQS